MTHTLLEVTLSFCFPQPIAKHSCVSDVHNACSACGSGSEPAIPFIEALEIEENGSSDAGTQLEKN